MFKYLCLWYLTLIVSGPILGQRVLATAEFDPGVNPIEEAGYAEQCINKTYA